MNIPLLRRIQRQIDKAPERFAMGTATTETSCGTAFCIGGWALALNGTKIKTIHDNGVVGAADLLDINWKQRSLLFWTHNWPKQFQALDGTPELPALAIARIDHFIATEGRE